MTNFIKEKTFNRNNLQIIAAVIFSGVCWYISNGLNGDFWYLLWLAPVPVLFISSRSSAKTIFWVALFSYLIGRLSWFNYLVSVATIVPAIIFTIILPLIFALIMVLSRATIRKVNSWCSVFVFPIFFTAFEWLMITFSPDGTAVSIAYSQANFIELVQIVSLTGILGITFIVTFIPSVLALGWYYRNDKRKLLPLSIISFLLLTSVFMFGFFRISNAINENNITVGLIVLEEKKHSIDKVDFEMELQHIKNYALKIAALAKNGAKVIVLPERAINLNRDIDSLAKHILINTAEQNAVYIVVGYTNLKGSDKRNSSLVIGQNGNVLSDYNKTHLVKGLEDRFTPGSQIGLFNFGKTQAGTAICKDLDFPKYIKNYGDSNTTLLCVPAWDFVVDDWLHSRMAILRGVENGFSIIRTARQGRLTISNSIGKVVAEENCSNGRETALLGQVSLTRTNTFYSKYGEWFGFVIISASLFLIILTIFRRNSNN